MTMSLLISLLLSLGLRLSLILAMEQSAKLVLLGFFGVLVLLVMHLLVLVVLSEKRE